MSRIGSRRTDLDQFIAAQILKTDIFVYADGQHVWNRFSDYGFNNKRGVHDLTEKRKYIRLYLTIFNRF